MTRYHFFSFLYPNQAKQISDGYSIGPTIVWNAFTKATGLNRFFKFTPSEFNTADQAEAKGQGTPEWYSDEITIE